MAPLMSISELKKARKGSSVGSSLTDKMYLCSKEVFLTKDDLMIVSPFSLRVSCQATVLLRRERLERMM